MENSLHFLSLGGWFLSPEHHDILKSVQQFSFETNTFLSVKWMMSLIFSSYFCLESSILTRK